MPYYRRTARYATRVVGKQKFSTFSNAVTSQIAIPQNGEIAHFFFQELIRNTTQQAAFVPPIMKVKHLKATVSFPAQMQSVVDNNVSYRAYLMFIPEGYDVLNNSAVDANTGSISGVIRDHPEWIMQSKQIPIDVSRTSVTTFYSRINRNLNSGDRIIVLFMSQWMANLQAQQKPAAIVASINYSYATRSN